MRGKQLFLKGIYLSIVVCWCVAFSVPGFSAPQQGFSQWVQGVKKDAVRQGVRQATVDAAFAHVQHLPKVIELDRKQPETTITFKQYLNNVVTASRIEQGKKLYRENQVLLEKIGKQYGVQPRFIVALWGIESNYGQNTGGFSIINALATLAYDGRRSAFFREELMNALKILDKGDVTVDSMKGSWAGAMGQTQFMPSSFLKLAVDYDGDGKRDIWGNKADAFASIANYLSKVGWDDRYTWGREVQVPSGINKKLIDIKHNKDLTGWHNLGVRGKGGKALPKVALSASLIQPSAENNLYYLAYPNYKVVLKWNRSLYFATAVGLLSDAIGN